MQKLDYNEAKLLNDSLNTYDVIEINGAHTLKQSLKSGKDLSGDNYLKVLSIKKKLRTLLEGVAQDEQQLFEDNDVNINGSVMNVTPTPGESIESIKARTKEIHNKLKAMQNNVSLEIEDAFIEREEFLKWTKDCNNEASSVLAEFLLKGFDK